MAQDLAGIVLHDVEGPGRALVGPEVVSKPESTADDWSRTTTLAGQTPDIEAMAVTEGDASYVRASKFVHGSTFLKSGDRL